MTERITADTLVKILDADGNACHGGSGCWHLPKNGKPGRWDALVAFVAQAVAERDRVAEEATPVREAQR